MESARHRLQHLGAVQVLHGLDDRSHHDSLTVLVSGKGAKLRDANGRLYIDGLSGLWNIHLGHGREELVEAAAEQMRRLACCTTYSGFSTVPSIQLAARLKALVYERLTATSFTPSGADANERAFKTARDYWRRQGKLSKVKILSLEHGYHAVTLAAMSAPGLSGYSDMFQPVVPGFIHVRAPYPCRCDFAAPGESGGAAAARIPEETIQSEGANSVAAFIAEPVQGAGGVIVPPDDYFPLGRETCNRHEILVIPMR